MTIEREPPGVWRAVCDSCGDDLLLGTEGERDEADEELRDRGWAFRPASFYWFEKGTAASYRVEYHEHDCPDCR